MCYILALHIIHYCLAAIYRTSFRSGMGVAFRNYDCTTTRLVICDMCFYVSPSFATSMGSQVGEWQNTENETILIMMGLLELHGQSGLVALEKHWVESLGLQLVLAD
jgi:hypothetical protein